SWVKSITKKARTLLNPSNNGSSPRLKKSHHFGGQEEESMVVDLEGEVMSCGYEDVQVMWSILDKS
ncbi:hypothetical protein M569_00451, partial [Genlisea aurea]